MSKFKVGDKVRLLDGSKIKDYAGSWAPEAMLEYVGTIDTIESVDESWTDGRVSYFLEDNGFMWDERGLELVESKPKFKSKFKVGDKVIGNANASEYYSITKEGWIGVVTCIDPAKCEPDDDIRVKAIDEEDGMSFSVMSKCFDLFTETPSQKIVITTDGKTTTAKLIEGKKTIKTAIARCAPSDTFDFGTGAALALERLVGNPEATLPEAFDWDAFKAGKLEVKVNRDNFDKFMKQCQEKNITWSTSESATTVNPWELFDKATELAKAIIALAGDEPREHVYVLVKHGYLKFGTKRNEELEAYEFV